MNRIILLYIYILIYTCIHFITYTSNYKINLSFGFIFHGYIYAIKGCLICIPFIYTALGDVQIQRIRYFMLYKWKSGQSRMIWLNILIFSQINDNTCAPYIPSTLLNLQAMLTTTFHIYCTYRLNSNCDIIILAIMPFLIIWY